MLDLGIQLGSARTRRSYEAERKDGRSMLGAVSPMMNPQERTAESQWAIAKKLITAEQVLEISIHHLRGARATRQGYDPDEKQDQHIERREPEPSPTSQ